MGFDFKKMTFEQKSDLFLLALIVIPILLSLFFTLTDDSQKDKAPEVEQKTWKEVMSPELKQKAGYVNQSSGVQSASSTSAFDKEDIHDIIDYNDGLSGEYSDIDYHDVEDYYAD